MAYDADTVIEAIESCRDQLGDSYGETVIRIRNEPDPDSREATKIAVDVAKTFMTISLAAFALIGLFARHYLAEDYALLSFKLLSLAGSAALALISMIIGLTAISTVYKRAAGIEAAEGGALWDIAPIRRKLNLQGYFGLGSIVAFVLAIAFGNTLNTEVKTIDILAVMPSSTAGTASVSLAPPFVVSGDSSKIAITKDEGVYFSWPVPTQHNGDQGGDRQMWSFRVSVRNQ